MILDILLWYLAILLSGWLVFPLLYRLLPLLPDRGLALSRPAGLLLWGYAWWLLTSFHILENNIGGVLVGLVIVAAISAYANRNAYSAMLAWLRENRAMVWLVEGVFLVTFAAWLWVRGTHPDIAGTEKPMELAFINAILRSPSFPPHDPWLSGYAISYYYFGYAIVAMLARICGVAGEVAFNLALATWFALAAAAACGLVYNLLTIRSEGGEDPNAKAQSASSARGLSLLAPLFLLLVSNLEGFLEMLHARGWLWSGQNGLLTSPFWKWLGIQELSNPPAQPFSWIPERVGGIWWWRASRVLQDFDMAGGSREIIDEFPFFSYLLGDLHPHVLSMPFVLLSIGLAMHVYLRERVRTGESVADETEILRWIRLPETWLAVITLGGLAFLNTWDFPIYLTLYGAAYVLAAFQREGWQWRHLAIFIGLAVLLGLTGILSYLPFYLGFQSQAGGFLPSLVFFTRGIHLWVMFAPLLAPIVIWLVVQAFRRQSGHSGMDWKMAGLLAVGVVATLWILSAGLGLLAMRNPSIAGIYGSVQGGSLVQEAFKRRLAQPGAWLSLLALLALALAVLLNKNSVARGEQHLAPVQANTSFVALLVLAGTGLVLFPEFFYLRDQFGWRMNTIFKFYYQAWVLWSLAAAYVSAQLWRACRSGAAWGARAAWLLVVAAALAYPLFGIRDRVRGFDPTAWTLDGAIHLARYAADDLAAIQWLRQAPAGVVVEAVGGSYSGYARAATFSGQPGVLGWPGHESQWRGGAKEMGSREADIEQLYRARRWEQAQEILNRYHIRYIFVGSLEKSKYGAVDLLFARHLPVAFQTGQATVYEVPYVPDVSSQ